MSFFQQIIDFKMMFLVIEKLSTKCVNLQCLKDFYEKCLINGIFRRDCHLKIRGQAATDNKCAREIKYVKLLNISTELTDKSAK